MPEHVFIHRVTSSHGELFLDAQGNVIRQDTPGMPKVKSFDLQEYQEFWGVEPAPELDILDLRGVLENGKEVHFKNYRERTRREQLLGQ
jgi:hypothetical protein